MSPTEEIKSRLDIIDVISEYFPLKPAGANWRARCPFHEERTPSFMVSKAKQIWHCFGCGEGGDIFGFIMKQEGLEFPDALRLLADKAGVQIKFEDPAIRSERQRMFNLLEAAVSFWSEVLWQERAAETARRYFMEERKLKPETIRAWRLGYALDSWEALINHLVKLGYKEEEMIKSGVAVRKMETRGRSAYDRFRNRLMFPIANTQGQVIGATGRILSASATEAKYVNTPETLLYHKGQVLYGLDKAKAAIKQQNLAIVVEGNMDAIASHEADVANVVASSGTALTTEQARLLKRFTENLAFAFDADAAGESATWRGLATVLSEGCQVSLISLPLRPDGKRFKDPDECIRANPKLWLEAIAKAEPMLEHYFRRAATEYDLTKLEDKQRVTKLILPLIGRLPDQVAMSHYLKKLANLVEVQERYLREALERQPSAGGGSVQRAANAVPAASAPVKDSRWAQSERLLAGLIAAPAQMGYAAAVTTPEMISPEYAALYREMVVFFTEQGGNDKIDWLGQEFAAYLNKNAANGVSPEQLSVLALLADKEFSDFTPLEIERELLSSVNRLKRGHLRVILQKLENDIRSIEQSPAKDEDRLASLFKEFQTVSAELAKMDNNKNSNRK